MTWDTPQWDKGQMRPKKKPPVDIPHVGTTIGPYIGFKTFELRGGHRPRIVSSYRSSVEWWPERTLEVADCRPNNDIEGREDPGHSVPDDNHWCGFYMFYELHPAASQASAFNSARRATSEMVGMVAAWGDVVHHDRGLRASRMEIIAIHDGPYEQPNTRKHLAREMYLPYLIGKQLEEAQALIYAGKIDEVQTIYGVLL